LATIADDDSGVSTPGSVAATRVAADLFEVLVCNNYVHCVTRHLVDLRDGCRVLGAEVVAASGLQIPDGVAVSRDRRWVAISSHLTHSVAIYDRARPGRLADRSPPQRQLPPRPCLQWRRPAPRGGRCRFAVPVRLRQGCRRLDRRARADLHVRQIDDDTFLRGRYNTQEGGPKGVDVDPSGRILAVTSEHEPLAFYDMSTIVTDDSAGIPSPVEPIVRFDEAGRELLLGAVVRNDDLVSRIDGLHAEIARLHEAVAD